MLISALQSELFVFYFLNMIETSHLSIHGNRELVNQSTDSGHSNQSGATNEVLHPVFSRAWRCGWIVFPRFAMRLDCFPARDALNSFRLDSGLFSLTTKGFLSSYSQTNVRLFIPLFNYPRKNYISI